MLKDVAYAMRKALRAFDLVYRVGGEEFVVLLPGADLERTLEVGERLRAAVAEQRTGDIAVTMSLGAAAARGGGVRFLDLYGAADAALYAAKRDGRNRVCAAGSRARSVWRSSRNESRYDGLDVVAVGVEHVRGIRSVRARAGRAVVAVAGGERGRRGTSSTASCEGARERDVHAACWARRRRSARGWRTPTRSGVSSSSGTSSGSSTVA